MKNLFKIGEIAELFHLNIKTLRYYDEIGLVKPEVVDRQSGYRYYSTRQFEQLNTIRYLRELGVSLSEIHDFLNNRETEKMEQILQDQIDQVAEKQRQLETIEKKLRARVRQIRDAKATTLHIPRFKMIPARKALLLRYAAEPDSDLEYPIRLLARDIPVASVFLGKIGLSIDEANVRAGKFGAYDYIFLLLDEDEDAPGRAGGDAPRKSAPETELFRGGKHAVIRFHGTHRDAERHYLRLMDFVGGEGYEPRGHSLEITLIDAGFTTDESQYVTEIQLPVRKKRRK